MTSPTNTLAIPAIAITTFGETVVPVIDCINCNECDMNCQYKGGNSTNHSLFWNSKPISIQRNQIMKANNQIHWQLYDLIYFLLQTTLSMESCMYSTTVHVHSMFVLQIQWFLVKHKKWLSSIQLIQYMFLFTHLPQTIDVKQRRKRDGFTLLIAAFGNAALLYIS